MRKDVTYVDKRNKENPSSPIYPLRKKCPYHPLQDKRQTEKKVGRSVEISFQGFRKVPLTSLVIHSKGWKSCLLTMIIWQRESCLGWKHQSHFTNRAMLQILRLRISNSL